MKKLNRRILFYDFMIGVCCVAAIIFLTLSFSSDKSLECMLYFMFLAITFSMFLILISYRSWLADIKDAAGNNFESQYAIFVPLNRVLTLYMIDQGSSWNLGYYCLYNMRDDEKNKTITFLVYFGILDYFRFKYFKNKQKKERENSLEIKVQKTFIESLQKDIDKFIKNKPK